VKSTKLGTDSVDVYEVFLKDMERTMRAFLMLQYQSSLAHCNKFIENADYLIDKIKITINIKGEIVLMSTEHLCMIDYKRKSQNEEDTQSLGS
jgi:5'(3')-deoxyribonucleotidase